MRARRWEKKVRLYTDEQIVRRGKNAGGSYIVICHARQDHWKVWKNGDKSFVATPCNCSSDQPKVVGSRIHKTLRQIFAGG